MVRTLDFYTINVFSDEGIRGGNQLAVITNAQGLTTQEMQTITKQFNYSESTFITNYLDDGASMRIFVPEGEVPFAGHPCVGTAFLVEKLWREVNDPRTEINLHLQQDTIRMHIDEDALTRISMEQLLPKELGSFDNTDEIIALLGIQDNELLSDDPFPLIGPSDIHFLFIPVTSPTVLATLRPNHEAMKEHLPSHVFPYVFAPKAASTVRARMFAIHAGIPEDPATGSAQASLALALHRLGLLPSDGSFVTEQGYEMGRPSQLYNAVRVDQDTIASCQTTGNNYLVSKGTLWLD